MEEQCMDTRHDAGAGLRAGILWVLIAATAVLAQEWKLVWSDEFDGTTLNDAVWTTVDWPPGYVNGEEQRYVPGHDQTGKNIRLENGKLVIEARRETNGQITSGRINSQGKKSWKYGKFECSAMLPAGLGTWPAIWSMPDNSPYGGWPDCGEIDIMEFFGKSPDTVQFSVHCNKYVHTKGTQKHAYLRLPGVCTGYHTYAMEWYPDSICGFADGKKYFSFPNEHTGWQVWPFDQNFHWILNLAMGGANFAGPIASTTLPCRFYVDYVRVYSHQTVDVEKRVHGKISGHFGIRQTPAGLEIEVSSGGPISVELTKINGSVVSRRNGINGKALIETRHCVPGVYLVRASGTTENGVERIVLR
jgi:beta-glucanase (GH16 family)